MKDLYDALYAYSQTDMYPFHMPGHKRRPMGTTCPELFDITEIYGFDNLHHAGGILKEAQERAARLYGSLESFFLVNGSTCGILAAVYASVKRHGRLLMARNCHASVYHGAELAGAKTDFVYPMETDSGIQGSVSPADVEEKLKARPDTEAVVITSPTYDGVVSDISAIARIAHSHGAILVVDEAHGAHFGFGHGFPEKAVTLGADLVIESLHKTLPAFTQSAILHRCSERVTTRELKKYLDIFQTSSPSYLFMAGIDRLTTLLASQGDALFSGLETRLRDFYDGTKDLRHLRVLPAGSETTPFRHRGIYARDISRILIFPGDTSLSGKELADILRERFHLEMEMSAPFYATALTGIMDTPEGFLRLGQALRTLDTELEQACGRRLKQPFQTPCAPPLKQLEIWEASRRPSHFVDLEKSNGAVISDYIYLYPPGIPILVPGEQMTDELLRQLLFFRSQGCSLEGMADESGRKIRILKKDLT